MAKLKLPLKVCANGDGRPVQPPSLVICRECMDQITHTLQAEVDRLKSTPREGRLSNPLQPTASLLCKLGSIAVHFDEAVSGHGHFFDIVATRSLVQDPEVQEWIAEMQKLALLPVKR